MDYWKFLIILMAFTAVASALYCRLMVWIAKKAGITIPTGSFRKFTFDNYTGNVVNAGHLHGHHELYFFFAKK